MAVASHSDQNLDESVEQPGTTLPSGQPLQVWTVDAMTRIGRNDAVQSSTDLSIAAARNEYEPFQLVVAARGSDLAGVNAQITDFSGPAGVISAENVKLYREHYVKVDTPSYLSPYQPDWYPDALIPFSNPYTGGDLSGPTYDGAPFSVSDGFNQPIWVDVFVPLGTVAGDYTATLTVTANGDLRETVSIQLTVWQFALPTKPSQRSAFGLSPEMLDWFYGIDGTNEPEQFYPLLSRYSHMLVDHRLAPSLLSGVEYDIDARTGEIRFYSNDIPGLGRSSEEILSYFMDEKGVNSFKVSLSADTPFTDPLGSQREQAKRFLGSLGRYFSNLGWGDRLYVYVVDEPSSAVEYQSVRAWGALVHEANQQYGVNIKHLVTEKPTPENPEWGDLTGAVDIWVPCCGNIWADLEAANGSRSIEKRLAMGEEVWWYTALAQPTDQWMSNRGWPAALTANYSPVWLLDYPPTNFRISSWLNQRYGFNGLLYWTAVNWQESTDVWIDPATYYSAGHRYNGEGLLLYPGRTTTVGYDGPVASIRLKWLREGMEDYDYIQMLGSLGEESYALSQVMSVAEAMDRWEMDSDSLYLARRTIGERLHLHYSDMQQTYLPSVRAP